MFDFSQHKRAIFGAGYLCYYCDPGVRPREQEYLHANRLDIHNTKVLKIPTPEFYVIYTGTTSVPSRITLRDDFFENASCPIDLEATVLTTETDDIIGQYITFCRVLDDQVKEYGKTEEAVWKALRICNDRGVLKKYLAEREKEVVSIVMVLFDQEYATERYGETKKAEGREEGLKEGRQEAARGMYETGLSLDVIACSLKTTVDTVKKMIGIGQEPFALG